VAELWSYQTLRWREVEQSQLSDEQSGSQESVLAQRAIRDCVHAAPRIPAQALCGKRPQRAGAPSASRAASASILT